MKLSWSNAREPSALETGSVWLQVICGAKAMTKRFPQQSKKLVVEALIGVISLDSLPYRGNILRFSPLLG